MAAPRHWHVLGAGAIGCLFASLLQQAGARCTLLLRDDDPALETGETVITVRSDGQCTTRTFPVSACHEADSIRHLLVTTKAYDVVPAVASVGHRLSSNSTVVLLANGLGFQETLAGRWPTLDYYSATTTEGVFREATRSICHAGRGQTLIGQPGRTVAPDWFSDWQALAIDCSWAQDIEQALWRKLAINCAINPLTALHHCRNGELATNPALALEVRALCAEIETIGTAAGQVAAVEHLREQVAAVITGTANNRSSMLQDVAAGRETEIDYLSGYLVRVANGLGLPAPRNAAMLDAVRALSATVQAQGPGVSR
ncbi:2-dehydropantoate 2-reductase [Kineobactrum sediminis]|uniref:2-dehydropantoate 2-reductase n=1 Tax=Kineobactrum sediminis TaxID=1905677 RepID=A0A2N5Y3I9_9GAMM|nr:2-dehydropantoate 2-reductase [Kineobactrum sediminis]PLW82965.1 2-dehydropantoate 2-reductase [Kineobactrum sediminis]